MQPIVKLERVEIEDPPPNLESEEDSQDESSDNEQQSQGQTSEKTRQSTKSKHVSVQRSDIRDARIREGNDELQGLDIDVYDQQTYERTVFDQVDKAISGPSSSAEIGRVIGAPEQNSSTINDFMRLIHDERQDEMKETLQARDEEILKLTRQQRLNRQIKSEPRVEPDNNIPQLPKVPRHQRDTNQPTSNDKSASRIDVKPKLPEPRVKRENIELTSSFLDEDIEEVSSLSGNESSTSEYRPSAQETGSDDDLDDDNEDIDYQTDSDPDNGDLSGPSDVDVNANSKKIKDDGDFKSYAARIKAYNRSRAQLRLENINKDGVECKKLDEMVKIDGDLHIPKDIWENLFEHQKTGVRWLWELHQLGTGGILGDEMGLGKTIQMIAFLVALRKSNVNSLLNGFDNLGPTVLVCPATVMHQWLQEFRKWYPPFRVAILHNTGTFNGDRKQLVRIIHKSNGILICSYPGVIIYQDYLHVFDWHYVILDEGHKIKNPDSQVTLACKRFRTPHRIILSGSPVQNNLRELWSIFDFIYPGKLGILPVFLSQFSIPITQGGYANATDMQVQIAYKCACVLRDTIKPFLLRRSKAEVNSKLKLPERSEQVLFCKLTEKQRRLYQYFLDSPTVRDIKRGKLQIFVGLTHLRKICNHPDIFDASECNLQMRSKEKTRNINDFIEAEHFGHFQKSGKMMVVDALLKLWRKQGDKVLLFTQSRQMLKIFERYLNERDYKYLTMDGSTPIGIRHVMIDEFNTKGDIFVFLLTTRVGGVGVNLIGANRIIIYDPDWNPSTDIQARERAWRIGQQRHVIIYRLLTAGTIEEKIYHRQVFKLYLTNRIMKDAKQKRFFKTNDLHELFTLGQDDKNIETKALFDDDLQIDEKSIEKSKKKDKKRKRKLLNETNIVSEKEPRLPEEKLKEMRERAKRLSRMIALKYGEVNVDATPSTSQSSGPARINGETIEFEPLHLMDDDVIDRMGNHQSSTLETSSQSVSYCPSIKSLTDDSLNQSSERKKKRKKQQVEYLVKQDVYKPVESRESAERHSRYKHDDYILGRLLKNSSISGALKHDKIEGDSTHDFKVVESEAEKVARDAIRALRESRRLCLSSRSGMPNWTGRSGQMASSSSANRLMPSNKARAQQFARSTSAPSTSRNENQSILASIKKRNQANPVIIRNGQMGASLVSDDEEANRDFVGRAKEASADDIADKICNFLLYNSSTRGETQTGEMLDFFKQNFKPDQTAIFKAILYKICEFQRRGNVGFWKLRSEFRSM